MGLSTHRTTPPPWWARASAPVPALVGLLAAVALMRLVMALAVPGPVTIDGGNWLAFGHDLLGPNVRSSSIVYPPVVPLLSVAATTVFGLAGGMALLVAVTSIAPAAGCAVVLHRAGTGRTVVPIVAVVALAGSSGESAAWGGFPQLLAFGLLPPMLWLLDRHLRRGGLRSGLAVGGLAVAIVATSHFVVAVAALAGGVLVGAHLVLRPGGSLPPPPHRFRHLAVGLSLSLPFVPLYRSLQEVGRSVTDGDARRGLTDLPEAVDYVVRDLRPLWWAAVVVVFVVPLVVADRRRTPLWLVSTSTTTSLAVLFVVLRDARVVYGLPVAAALAVGLLVTDRRVPSCSVGVGRSRRRRAVALAVAAVVAVQAVAGARLLDDQLRYYAVAGGGVGEAVAWIGSETDPDTLVAVAPVRAAPVGWWVEGGSRRPALVASALQWLYFPDERDRARVANEIFGPGFPTTDQLDLAQASGVDLLVVPTAWSGHDPGAVADAVDQGLVTVRYENRDVVVLAL